MMNGMCGIEPSAAPTYDDSGAPSGRGGAGGTYSQGIAALSPGLGSGDPLGRVNCHGLKGHENPAQGFVREHNALVVTTRNFQRPEGEIGRAHV